MLRLLLQLSLLLLLRFAIMLQLLPLKVPCLPHVNVHRHWRGLPGPLLLLLPICTRWLLRLLMLLLVFEQSGVEGQSNGVVRDGAFSTEQLVLEQGGHLE